LLRTNGQVGVVDQQASAAAQTEISELQHGAESINPVRERLVKAAKCNSDGDVSRVDYPWRGLNNA
jgi:hypothetical protein